MLTRIFLENKLSFVAIENKKVIKQEVVLTRHEVILRSEINQTDLQIVSSAKTDS